MPEATSVSLAGMQGGHCPPAEKQDGQ